LFLLKGFPRLGVDLFLEETLKNVKKIRVLDAGAGDRRYAHYFKKCDYESCDHPDMKFSHQENHTFYCDLNKIPRPENYYDLILCSQVLEHVPEPSRIFQEFYRVLKPNCNLIITTPQCSGLHMEPFNYFNFLKYGLQYLCETNKFKAVEIRPLGGVFFVLGKCLDQIFVLLLQKINVPSVARNHIHKIFLFVMSPLNFLLLMLDSLDLDKKWTLNYGLVAKKLG
jgi:SAM-dependent methyltransferase